MVEGQDDKSSLINPNPVLQRYYASLESRIGYRLVLGGTRHFGYYASPSSFPIPFGPSLRAMEEQLFQALQCRPGSRVFDAGCGVGHVALYMAKRGHYEIEAIDVVQRHAARAQMNIKTARMEGSITARHGDYHHLEKFQSGSFDGVYTMETLVHSTNPSMVLKEFMRILKPGGRIALHEYDHDDMDKTPKELAEAMKKVNALTSMPANASFDRDILKDLLEGAGFQDVRLRDISQHIVPMLWAFYLLAVVPYMFFRVFGIEHYFPNAMAGVYCYKGRRVWRYIQVTGKKPI
ncbi:MAG: hypothetical protein M1820_006439 [Bogoriella megaspora]|nr:MAG: hypothetical protein M1820_006439 [Bogoriella megaspora]